METGKKAGVLMFCLLAALLLPFQALAAGNIDLDQTCSLTVTALYEQEPVAGMRFDAYQVATVDEYGEWTVTEAYQAYSEQLDIRGKQDEAWQKIAQTLARDILLDREKKGDDSAVTNAEGVAAFGGISRGLYLVIGSGVESGEFVYSTSPFFVMLPQQDPEHNTWDYQVTARAKLARGPRITDYEAVKIWKDEGHEEQRPESITLQLLCDGAVYDTVALPHEGAWKYTWNGLEANHHWTVAEMPVEGYRTEDIRQEENTFFVTNRYDEPEQTQNPAPAGGQMLPQTGQFWWPVPLLLAAGLLLVIAGLLLRRGNRHGR